jgi:hypothetical protein
VGRRRGYEVVISLLVVANMALGVYVALLWSGHFGDDAVTQASASPPAPAPVAPPPPPPPAPPPLEKTAAQSHAVPVKRVVLVTITASRGDCWMSAHRGSATGPLLAEKTLVDGETVSLRARRIWLELGAAGNVDVSVDGRPHPVTPGTTELVLG